MKLSAQIKSKRKSRGLTQQQLADACNVSRVTVGHWERGRNEPDAAHQTKLVDAIGFEITKKSRVESLFTHSASVWSNPSKKNDPSLLPARLLNANFLDLFDLCMINGVAKVQKTLKNIRNEMKPMQYSIEKSMLDNIAKGIQRAGRH